MKSALGDTNIITKLVREMLMDKRICALIDVQPYK